MTIAEMFGQSAILTLLGMTVVFGFLIILVLFMNLVASMIRALGWDKELQEIPQSPILQVSNDSNSNPAIVAAIASAVEQYRREH